jgi:FkbM family methyltransferase
MVLIERLRRATASFGFLGAAIFSAFYALERIGLAPRRYRLTPPGSRSAVVIRGGTSDLSVYFQVFTGVYDDAVGDGDDIMVIADCGANVGYSAVYFLNRIPKCRVIAIEPDPGNYKALVENTGPYGDRVLTIQSALWSHRTRLAMRSTGYRDSKEWTRQVAEAAPGTPEAFDALDVCSIFELAGVDRIDLLKIDIEGAEAVLFGDKRAGALDWLASIRHLAVELHDDSIFGPATPAFERAMSGMRGQRIPARDVVIVRNMSPLHPVEPRGPS